MAHDFGVGQSVALALGAGGQDDGGAAGGQSHAVRRDRAFQELHRVVNRQRRGHRAAGAVDVEVDLLVAVLVLQEEQFLDGDIGEVVRDCGVAAGLRRTTQEDDTVLQEQIAQGHLSLTGIFTVALNLRNKRRRVGVCFIHGYSSEFQRFRRGPLAVER